MSETSGIMYECIRCGNPMPESEIELRGGHVKCINCGYKVLRKVKPPIVTRRRAV